MADSETSRTLPAISRRKAMTQGGIAENLPDVIDRRNLLAVAARLLSEKIAQPVGQPRASGPTPCERCGPDGTRAISSRCGPRICEEGWRCKC